jgi:3-oxoacyl-(acyl-carrier-protein) synthase
MDIYIKGTGLISAAGDNSDEQFLTNAPEYNTDRLLSKEPNYTAYIPPMQLRRMSKAVRIGIGASKIALQDAGIEKPDALSIGTAMGCLQDTEVFLSKLVEQNEQMLTPTAFIQSTHNTVGGQIALLSGCYGHNLTYVHRGHSFEHAVINAQLYLNDHPQEKILVGGIDELTDSSIQVLKATGVYRVKRSNENLLHTNEPGSLAGEGASFFIMDKLPSAGALQIKAIGISNPADSEAALEKLHAFLNQHKLSSENIDLVMSGWNGDSRGKYFYDEVSNIFSNSSIAGFKHLSGEYATASAFGLGMVTQIIKKGSVPEYALLNDIQPKHIKNILLINNHMRYFSVWHLAV